MCQTTNGILTVLSLKLGSMTRKLASGQYKEAYFLESSQLPGRSIYAWCKFICVKISKRSAAGSSCPDTEIRRKTVQSVRARIIDLTAMFSRIPINHRMADINDHDGDAPYLWVIFSWRSFIDDHKMQIQASRHLTGAKHSQRQLATNASAMHVQNNKQATSSSNWNSRS
jgi:hypothetical protein